MESPGAHPRNPESCSRNADRTKLAPSSPPPKSIGTRAHKRYSDSDSEIREDEAVRQSVLPERSRLRRETCPFAYTDRRTNDYPAAWFLAFGRIRPRTRPRPRGTRVPGLSSSHRIWKYVRP